MHACMKYQCDEINIKRNTFSTLALSKVVNIIQRGKMLSLRQKSTYAYEKILMNTELLKLL